MKVKLLCNKDKYEEYKNKLHNENLIFTDDDPELLIIEKDYRQEQLFGRNKNDEYEMIKAEDIIFVESFGHDVIVHTMNSSLQIREKLYEVEGMFEDKGFIRIHRSYVINKNQIKSIKPTYNTKFIVTMNNDMKIEVTRNYYYIFKKYIGF